MPVGRISLIYGASLVLHGGVALAVSVIPPEKPKRAPTVIEIREVKRKPEPAKVAEPPPPPPPKPEERVQAPPAPRVERKVQAPTPAPAEATPAPAGASANAPVADFGLALSGSVAPGGIAVPVRDLGQGPVHTTKEIKPKALKPEKKTEEAACVEALIKPKPISVPQPVYSDQARENNIAGKVRVELTVDENGEVVSAKILEALGYGLDEAALAAAKASRFSPAMHCGKAVSTTFVIGIRFSL